MRKQRVGKPIGEPDTPEKRAARRKRLAESLVRNLNANVLKDHSEKSTPAENTDRKEKNE